MRKHKHRSGETSPNPTTTRSDRIYPSQYVENVCAKQPVNRWQRHHLWRQVVAENQQYLLEQIRSDRKVSAYVGTTLAGLKQMERHMARHDSEEYFLIAWDRAATQSAFMQADDAAVRYGGKAVILKLGIKNAQVDEVGNLQWTSNLNNIAIDRVYTLDEYSVLEGDMALEDATRIINVAARAALEG